ncbi:glucose-1-phosphate adenylyltransferase subunit GlgD [Clostridium sp. DJ247]|uniref:glucose-1-phosphate adenylyltransferase subunit GlgD n=1 Tax=Clostridium sp. DJ247 TaxID=2726188 RepID=UPI001623D3B4|nr:glucose-1-phosphate adenylyltransferase subunit GlgD [Clostridium sp. DJ247]MBC2578733.1 glucose-1-phosphate adenylyltransferase subunit GlgD [Clostridium sp. DJ247]
MLKSCLGIINLDENEDKIRELTRNRPLASIPIAGRYRVIDFMLSNLANAGIQNIGIFCKMQSRSLMEHLNNGRPWGLNRKTNALRFFNFTITDPYIDDITNFANNIEYLYRATQKYVIFAPSYMICNIDFREILKKHIESGSNITMVYKKVDNAEENFYGCDALNIDENGTVLGVGKNVGNKKNANIGMGIYIMKKELLIHIINECVSTGCYKKVKSYIYNSLDKLKVRSHEFNGYLACLNSLKSYYKASMDLLDNNINKELFSQERPLYTRNNDEAPAKYSNDCVVKNSIVANGCSIEGTVENSIIFRKVKVSKGAVLKNCVILQNCIIGENAKLYNIITDKYVNIGYNKELRGDITTPLVVEKNINMNGSLSLVQNL